MGFVICPAGTGDEPIFRELVDQALLSPRAKRSPSREIVHRPEFSRYVEGWGRAGDTGFVAHSEKDGALLGAVWMRKPINKPDAPPELALAVKPEHRRPGIGAALL